MPATTAPETVAPESALVPGGLALYSSHFTAEELAALVLTAGQQKSLKGEIAYARIFLRRLLAATTDGQEMPTAQLAELSRAAAALLRTLIHLMQEERSAGQDLDQMDVLMTEVLGELGEEWELDLLGKS